VGDKKLLMLCEARCLREKGHGDGLPCQSSRGMPPVDCSSGPLATLIPQAFDVVRIHLVFSLASPSLVCSGTSSG